MRDLRTRLNDRRQKDTPFVDPPRGREAVGVRWVRPELVAEVEYLSWDGRGRLRHPSFEALRLDKPAADVVFENVRAGGDGPGDDAGDGPHGAAPTAAPATTSKSSATKTGGTPGRRTAEPVADSRPAEPSPADPSPADPPPAEPSRAEPSPTRGTRKRERRELVAGVAITNPDRLMYPDSGLTKLEVARYYESVGGLMLPHIARRPLTLVRCPGGYAEECFFQKRPAGGFPETVLRVPVEEEGELVEHFAVDSLAGLLSLVQMGALEFHVGGAHIDSSERPDQLCFDLDPDSELPFARVAEAARLLRGLLDGLGLRSFLKTTGGKGLHVLAPIAPTRPWDEAKPFTKALAEAIARADPERYVATMALKKRTGRIFIDYLRNGRGASYVAPYSTRGRPGAPVSTPLRWEELSPSLRADQYTVGNMRRRLAGLKDDPWHGFHEVRQSITNDMVRAVGLG